MTSEYLRWTANDNLRPLFCFTKGCKEEAMHIVRIEFGPALVQLCLCGDCSNESPHAIISGVTAKEKRFIN